MAFTLDALIAKLQQIRANEGADRPVRMEVSGNQVEVRTVRVEDTDQVAVVTLVE